MQADQVKANLTSQSQWLRGLYMLLMVVAVQIAQFILSTLVIVQFIFALVTSHPNGRMMEFSQNLNLYVMQILQYLTYNSDEKPFPFRDWPNSRDDITVNAHQE